ncbi:MAG: head-tail adaptor protein [Bullifex sp.]
MIGGNVKAELQVRSVEVNSIGERVETWTAKSVLIGFLDLAGGSVSYEAFNSKVQESTHVFICDYIPLDISIHSRLLINKEIYDITLIDNPMNLNRQLEFYLKKVGF